MHLSPLALCVVAFCLPYLTFGILLVGPCWPPPPPFPLHAFASGKPGPRVLLACSAILLPMVITVSACMQRLPALQLLCEGCFLSVGRPSPLCRADRPICPHGLVFSSAGVHHLVVYRVLRCLLQVPSSVAIVIQRALMDGPWACKQCPCRCCRPMLASYTAQGPPDVTQCPPCCMQPCV